MIQDVGKGVDAVARGPLVRRAGPFVEGDQVDLGGDPFQELYQPVRVFLGVVHPVQHHIFKRDPFRVRQAGIGLQRIQQGFDIPALVDRNQLVTHGVCGGVKADGQKAADFGRGAGDFGDHAAGRQGDAAAAKGDAFTVHHDLHRVADVVEVVKRLAHPHQDDVGNQAHLNLRGALHRPFAKVVARQHHLAHNLTCGQVADQFLRAGVAEGTGQRAPDLRGDAQRAPVGFGDIDHLDLMPAGDADKVFAGAILGNLAGDDLRQFDGEMVGQERAVVLGKVGHLREITHAPMIDPLPQLPKAHLGLLFRRSSGDQGVAQLVAGQADDVGLAAFRQLARQGQHVLSDRGSDW